MFTIQSVIQKLLNRHNYVKVSTIKNDKKKIIKYKNTLNKDSLPIGLTLIGSYCDKQHTCKVDKKGKYLVDGVSYNSLSEAARATTGVRTEGWRFWKIYYKGPSILDAFKKQKENKNDI